MDFPRILIVDDSSFIRRLLVQEFKQLGAQVSEAEDGHKGLQMVLSNDFDLIVSDVEMPVMDGFALCEAIKSNPDTRTIPVILLSSLDSDAAIEKGFNAGASAYVSKSDGREQFRETIQRVLGEFRFHRSRYILVVDDSAVIRKLIKVALERVGFYVLTAGNGRQAIEVVKAKQPDLILSDIDMPEMNGIEFCKALHADPQLATIPFVTMSSNNGRSVMRRMLEWGAVAYLVKPFNLDEVVILVEKLLSDQFLLLLKERERLDSERKLMIGSITSLIMALEARDQYTRGHSESVAALVSEMAVHRGLAKDEIDSLEIAAKLHDIGKIGVPDAILLKRGPLTDEEYLVIKEHPVTGANILGSNAGLEPLLPVILYHHERYDGKGYPSGLKGEEIPLWARMTAVADTYHALTSDRPYRRKMSRDEALQLIKEVRGTQLCPECVDTFISMMLASTTPFQNTSDSNQI